MQTLLRAKLMMPKTWKVWNFHIKSWHTFSLPNTKTFQGFISEFNFQDFPFKQNTIKWVFSQFRETWEINCCHFYFYFPSKLIFNPAVVAWPASLLKTRHWSILELISQVSFTSYYNISLIYPWRITDHDVLSFSYISKYSTMESSWRFQIEILFVSGLFKIFLFVFWLAAARPLPGPHDVIIARFISQNVTSLYSLACPTS